MAQHEIAKSDWAEVVKYLFELDEGQIKLLGGLLGLSAANVDKMRDLPEDMVRAWLRGEEEVMKKCGPQLTWETLAQKLREMVPPQTHIAAKILKEQCTPDLTQSDEVTEVASSVPQTTCVITLTGAIPSVTPAQTSTSPTETLETITPEPLLQSTEEKKKDKLQALFNQFHLTLEENSSLTIEKINLGGNNIGDDGAKCLSEGLKYCPELQTLDLSWSNIGDDGAKCLSEVLKYCPKLQTLYLHINNIGDDGAKCLSEVLKYCPKLQTLYVQENPLSDEGEAILRDEVNSKRGPPEEKLNVFKSKAERTVQEVTERRAIEAEEKVKTQLQETDRKQSSALDLPGVQFIFEGKLTIKRSDQLQTLDWKNHGLKIHVPPGALPDSEDTCDIDVATSFSENFILPPNYTLLSAIYYVQPSMDLLKPVTLEIEHCCSVKNESNMTILSPIFAQCSHRSPPYTFQLLESSSNEIKSFVGRFEVSTFSLFGFGKRITAGMQQTEEFYCGRVYYRQNQSNGCFFVRLVAIPRLTDFLLMVEKQYSRHWHLMRKFEFSFSENSDVLQILVNRSGITTDNGWVIKPCVVPLEIEKKNIDFREFPEPASCEMSVRWSKKDEDPQDLELRIKMKGISLEELLITLSPQSGTAVAGINTDSSEYSSPSQTSVPVKVVDESDWAAICGYLQQLDRSQIERLGGELGLSVYNLQHMLTLPDEMVTAWLRKEDDVKVKSGDPLSWNVLSKALDKIGQQGIASDIRSQHCN